MRKRELEEPQRRARVSDRVRVCLCHVSVNTGSSSRSVCAITCACHAAHARACVDMTLRLANMFRHQRPTAHAWLHHGGTCAHYLEHDEEVFGQAVVCGAPDARQPEAGCSAIKCSACARNAPKSNASRKRLTTGARGAQLSMRVLQQAYRRSLCLVVFARVARKQRGQMGAQWRAS